MLVCSLLIMCLYLAAAGQSDWGWACRCHYWCLPPTKSPACFSPQHCTRPAGQHDTRVASLQPWGSSGLRWQLAGRRVSTRQMSCWGEQQQEEGSRAAEAECENTAEAEWISRVAEAELECTRVGWFYKQVPIWVTMHCCCKWAQTWACLVSLPTGY